MRIGIQIVTWHLTHFRVPLLMHSSMWPGCGINRSYLAVYIDCVAVSERLRAFTADWMFDYTFHWKSRILQDPHAAGINKIDFVFLDFPYLQGSLPRHCRKSSIYCQIKFRMNPLAIDFVNDFLPFWWMEVYPLLALINQYHCYMPKLND